MPNEDHLPTWATALFAGISGGIVSKICFVGMTAFGAIGVVCYSMAAHAYVALGCVVLVAIMFVYLVERLLRFAVSNPSTASMEGKELLEWMKRMSEIKGSGQPAGAVPPPSANVSPPQVSSSSLLPPEESKNA